MSTTFPIHSVLSKVETIEHQPNSVTIEQDGSDNKGTKNTIYSKSLELGPLAPGQTSSTKIIQLKVPSSLGITNIKLGLIDTGGIEFTNTTFGISTLSALDYNHSPTAYFRGVNSEKSPSNEFNISIPNDGKLQSEYVYINVKLPLNFEFKGGTIRYKWFFDYESGVATSLPESDSPPQQEYSNAYLIYGSNNPEINGIYSRNPLVDVTYKNEKLRNIPNLWSSSGLEISYSTISGEYTNLRFVYQYDNIRVIYYNENGPRLSGRITDLTGYTLKLKIYYSLDGSVPPPNPYLNDTITLKKLR